jgi:hypothetical protein
MLLFIPFGYFFGQFRLPLFLKLFFPNVAAAQQLPVNLEGVISSIVSICNRKIAL